MWKVVSFVFEGVGNVRPSDVLTEGHAMGTLLANVELQPARIGERIKVDNIYYDYDKHDIRPDAAVELDKLITLIRKQSFYCGRTGFAYRFPR